MSSRVQLRLAFTTSPAAYRTNIKIKISSIKNKRHATKTELKAVEIQTTFADLNGSRNSLVIDTKPVESASQVRPYELVLCCPSMPASIDIR